MQKLFNGRRTMSAILDEIRKRVFHVLASGYDYCFDWSEIYPWLGIRSKREAYKILDIADLAKEEFYADYDSEIIDNNNSMYYRYHLSLSGIKKVLRLFSNRDSDGISSEISKFIQEYEDNEKAIREEREKSRALGLQKEQKEGV